MKKMNIPLMATLLVLSIVVCPILYFAVGPTLDAAQRDTLKILGIIAGCSAAYCFVVGEATGNNSQMDKLWSLLPIAYTWIIAVRGGMSARLVVMAVLVTLWGIRLTFNFARKEPTNLSFGKAWRTTVGRLSVQVRHSKSAGHGRYSTSVLSPSTKMRWY